MIRSVLLAAWPLIALGAGTSVAAEELGHLRSGQAVAIVEEVSGVAVGIKRLDLLRESEIIDLGEDGQIVLGFLQSCWQDSVWRGQVTVGAQQSRVDGGTLIRRRVECDPTGNLEMVTGRASGRRKSAESGASSSSEPDIVLFGRSPIVLFPGPGQTLVIERLDSTATPVRNEATEDRLDLADHGVVLATNGLYRAAAGGAVVVFRIDRLAESGRTPAAGRLLVLR